MLRRAAFSIASLGLVTSWFPGVVLVPRSLPAALVAFAVCAAFATWWLRLLLATDLRREQDDDAGGGSGDDDPQPEPPDGDGGLTIDWHAFERDFADHVRATRDVVGACTEPSIRARSATSSSTPTPTAA